VKSKGDTIGWVYDLGDWWEHQIVLEDVVKSSGVALLGGEMSCPAEDWEGNEVWQETVMKQLPYPVILDISILNYKETGQDKLRPMYGQAIFDASHFDLNHYKEQLKVSLGSNLRLQQPGVAKSFSGSTTGQPIEEIVRGSLAWCAGRECGGDGMMEDIVEEAEVVVEKTEDTVEEVVEDIKELIEEIEVVVGKTENVVEDEGVAEKTEDTVEEVVEDIEELIEEIEEVVAGKTENVVEEAVDVKKVEDVVETVTETIEDTVKPAVEIENISDVEEADLAEDLD